MYKPHNMMTSKTSFTGMMLTFITAIFWGLYAVTVKRYVIRYPPVLAFGVISLYTALCLDFLAVIFGKLYMLGNMDAVKITLLIGSGIIGIAIAHVLSYTAIAGLGTIVTTGVSLTGPFVTSLGGYILLGEVLSLSQWLGGIMIISGALLLLLARFQSSREIAQIDIE
jgi:drug/metabolite transporter (DMT)-like permease